MGLQTAVKRLQRTATTTATGSAWTNEENQLTFVPQCSAFVARLKNHTILPYTLWWPHRGCIMWLKISLISCTCPTHLVDYIMPNSKNKMPYKFQEKCYKPFTTHQKTGVPSGKKIWEQVGSQNSENNNYNHISANTRSNSTSWIVFQVVKFCLATSRSRQVCH